MSASFVPTGALGVGHISLYEMNVDRNSNLHTFVPSNEVNAQTSNNAEGDFGVKSLIFPFITKNGSFSTFRTVTADSFNSDFAYGDILTMSFPLSASISREFFAADSDRKHISGGLINTLNHYKYLSPHYAYSSSARNVSVDKASPYGQAVPGCDKETQALSLIHIPSIFYGSSIKKGSVYLNFYVSGALMGQLHDRDKNGELVEVTSSVHATGNVGGVVLYNEGFLILTGSWDLSATDFSEKYEGTSAGAKDPKWLYFGVGANDNTAKSTIPSSSFSLEFKGTNYIPTITMFAHANKSLNYSNNPTFLDWASGSRMAANFSENTGYQEYSKMAIKNTVTSSFISHSADFQKQVFISKIGIYDKERNLIAIAKMATPVRKRENDELTFKLKLDI